MSFSGKSRLRDWLKRKRAIALSVFPEPIATLSSTFSRLRIWRIVSIGNCRG
ncbi:hypothetical protein [Microcoleus sp.]|uniref:hypothetical protein n=1 Tax=Microcoleus sp. TaxID=44472 RepID=UPI003594116F